LAFRTVAMLVSAPRTRLEP